MGKDNKSLMKYAGMAFQLFATLGVAFFIGHKADEYFELSFPIFLLSLPLLVMIGIFYQVLKDTSKKNE